MKNGTWFERRLGGRKICPLTRWSQFAISSVRDWTVPVRDMKTIYVALLGLAAAALLGLGVWIGLRAGRKPAELTETVVIEKVRQIAKLATVEHQIAEIVTFEEESPWPIFGRDKKALVVARGKVLAGFDLKKPISCRMTASGRERSVEIHMPAPEIIAVDPSYQFYDDRNLTKEQREWLLATCKRTIASAARKAGMFEDAERSLALFLSTVFPDVRFSLTFGDRPYKGPTLPEAWNPEMRSPNN